MRISDWSSDVCSSDLKVATPEAVPGVVRQRRKEDALNGGVGAQGFRNLHRGGCLPLKARCQRAEAALSKEAVVGRNAEAEVAAGVLDLPMEPFVVDRDTDRKSTRLNSSH